MLEATYPLPGGALLTTRATGNVWSYPNVHGDVASTATQTGTKMGATHAYDPYGTPLTASLPDNSAGDLDDAWLGHRQRPLEHQPGLQPIIEMGARQYSPLLGRFLEVDPIEGGSANNYDYAEADPINQYDLDGLWCITGVARRERIPVYKSRRVRISAGRYVTVRYISHYKTKEICRSMSRGAGRVARGAVNGAATGGAQGFAVGLAGCAFFAVGCTAALPATAAGTAQGAATGAWNGGRHGCRRWLPANPEQLFFGGGC